jgi:hypothetical protein
VTIIGYRYLGGRKKLTLIIELTLVRTSIFQDICLAYQGAIVPISLSNQPSSVALSQFKLRKSQGGVQS